MQMRLFTLRHGRYGALVLDSSKQPLYFSSKPEAKTERDRSGGKTVVSLGPDHNKFKGTK